MQGEEPATPSHPDRCLEGGDLRHGHSIEHAIERSVDHSSLDLGYKHDGRRREHGGPEPGVCIAPEDPTHSIEHTIEHSIEHSIECSIQEQSHSWLGRGGARPRPRWVQHRDGWYQEQTPERSTEHSTGHSIGHSVDGVYQESWQTLEHPIEHPNERSIWHSVKDQKDRDWRKGALALDLRERELCLGVSDLRVVWERCRRGASLDALKMGACPLGVYCQRVAKIG